MASGVSGVKFFGEQLVGGHGRAADDDLAGAVVIGRDWETGTTTSGKNSSISFYSVDMEGSRRCWTFRTFGETNLDLHGLDAYSNQGSGEEMLGFLKMDNPGNSAVVLNGNSIRGVWKNERPIALSGTLGPGFHVHEQGTRTNSVRFGGATSSSFVVNLAKQSQLAQATALFCSGSRGQFLLGGMLLRNNSGVLERSTDWGTTWTAT